MKRKLLSLLLALSLLTGLSAPALAAETAAVIRLTKTTGTVEISKSSGKPISLLTNMRLYNGYHVETAEESYAWINLDDSKLLKEDAASEIEVRKDGKKLEVQLRSGNVFFDVAEPLEDDESLNIRTSTMIVGVRGTSGWIQVVDRWRTMVSVLEGTVECTVTDPVTGQLKSAEIEGGETAECVVYPQEQAQQRCDILMKKYPIAEIPGFVLTDLTRDMKLCDKIEELTGLDIPRDLASVAGGDPSGRTPDRESATAEVLGEADRREDEDEDALHDRIEEIENELGKQPDNISPSKPIEKPSTPAPAPETPDRDDSSDSDSDSGDSGTTTPTPTPPTPPQASGMKLTDVQVQALLDAGTSVSVARNTDAADTTPKKNTLEVDTGLSVASGKTLDLQSGIDVEVYSGKTLRVDGTLTADALTNNGTTTVTSGNTLRLRGNLTTSGTLTVTSTGRVVVDGTFTNSGAVALTAGAKVLAKTFAPNAAPEGWEVSAETDADGYYSLTSIEGAPGSSAVNFDANGGKWSDGSGEIATRTGEDGKLPDWPADPVYGIAPATEDDGPGLEFAGWFDAEGRSYTAASTFTADVTLIAHWNGWLMDNASKTLIVAGNAAESDYDKLVGNTDVPGDRALYTSAPWEGPLDSGLIETIEITEGTARIGNNTFMCAYSTFGMVLGDSKVAKVTIPNSVTSIGESAFHGCSSLTGTLTIPEGVTSIGDSAFAGCSSLTGTLTIPEGVTSIQYETFAGCSGLTGVEIPSSVSSIENYAFKNCSGLNSVSIPESVTSIGRSAFEGCSGLTGVEIPSSVSGIGDYAFYNCSGLTSVSIPEGVTSIEQSAFEGCSGLTSVSIPSSVKSIGSLAFYGCSALGSIDVDTANPSYSSADGVLFNKRQTTLIAFPPGRGGPYDIPPGVSSIGSSAFKDCTGLTSVSIPSGVSSIGSDAFSGCTGLNGPLTIPSSVSSIGKSAFSGCSNLNSVSILEGVKAIGDYAFRGCSGLTGPLTIPSSVSSIGNSAFSGCSGLTGTLTIPEGVSSIGNYAFGGCSGLNGTLTIPSSVSSIGNNVFSGCTGLTGVSIPEGVSSIGSSAFEGCTGLNGTLTIPSSVSSIGGAAFSGCSGLNGTLTIPEGVTTLGGAAFSGCTGLTGVIIPSSVSDIGKSAFSGCTGLTSVTISEGVSSIGESAFERCTGLTGVTIPPSVSDIGKSAFESSGLTSVTISEGVSSIGESAFERCTGLTGPLIIPEGVTRIGNTAFDYCANLNNVEIPASVTAIGNYAFRNCAALRIFYFTGTWQQWRDDVAKGMRALPENVSVNFGKLPITPAL